MAATMSFTRGDYRSYDGVKSPVTTPSSQPPEQPQVARTEALGATVQDATPSFALRSSLAPLPSNDAPTPLASNCVPKIQPPSLELGALAAPLASSSLTTFRVPRFSSESAAPIVVKRPIASPTTVTEFKLGLYDERHWDFGPLPSHHDNERATQTNRPPSYVLLPSTPMACHSYTTNTITASTAAAVSADDLARFVLSAASAAWGSDLARAAIRSIRQEGSTSRPPTPFTAPDRWATSLTAPWLRPVSAETVGAAAPPPTATRRATAATRLPSSAPPRLSTSAVLPPPAANVRGIPNYGQTCFMNSVLQALASLEPFGEYLERVVALQQHRVQGISPPLFDGAPLSPSEEETIPQLWLCSELLQVLHSVNGTSARRPSLSADGDTSTASPGRSSGSGASSVSSLLRRGLHTTFGGGGASATIVDPRPILRRVGQQHAEFRPKVGQLVGREQQDAQEFLQALLGLVADDSGISLAPSAVPCFLQSEDCTQVDGDHDNGDDDASRSGLSDVLTVASAARMRNQQLDFDLIGRTVVGPAGSEVTTAAAAAAATLDASQFSSWSETNASESSESSSRGLRSGSVPCSQAKRLLNGSNDVHRHRLDYSYDEKKQDEFYAPACPSESYEACNDVRIDPQPSAARDKDPESQESDSESRSDSSTKVLRLSAAIRRMLATTSSITPSPLSGWMGSALQCRTCRHVRPIPNVPFLDIPVVPTHVSNYLRRRQGVDLPSKVRPTDVGPPCTLEQCLEDFTSVERVHDVECRCCTLRRAVAELDDEALLLSSGIEALTSKAHKNVIHHGSVTPNAASADDPAKHLRDELERVQRKLNALRATSPDDEGALERVLAMNDPLDLEEVPKAPLHRSDAFKCLLLTRLPAVLCIHVQRRFYDPLTDQTAKTAQHVIFPEYLDVGPYCACGGAGTPVCEPSRRRGTQPSIPYRLMSVIVHAGGAFFGHYLTYRRDPNSSDRWFRISDNTVRTVDWNAVRQSQAYMLFYEAM